MEYASKWRKYATSSELLEKVEEYFNGISYYETVTDPLGNPVKNQLGEYVEQLKYAVPPTQEGLCMHLGISRVTWNKYKNAEWAMDVCAYADLLIQAWRVEQTSIRDKTNGLQFLLTNYSDYFNQRVELEVSKGLTMEDKKKVLDALRESYDAEASD